MLYMLGQERLERLIFPLGSLTKAEVRAEAERLRLPVAHKPESQEICFVGKDYRNFLVRHIPEAIAEGELVDTAGNVVGRHGGLPLYTIGQRSGLGGALTLPSPAAEGEGSRGPQRTYVVAMEPEANRIVVGREADLLRSTVRVRRPAFNVAQPDAERALAAKIRSHGQPAACRIVQDGANLEVQFEEPQRSVSPGQVIVFYDGDLCLGGGIID
jgi:tRNA-specific 2-thiouridylase